MNVTELYFAPAEEQVEYMQATLGAYQCRANRNW
jgi:hypothetical protein